jgi:hypothetical protein
MVFGPFSYLEQDEYLKILIRCLWEKICVGGGLVAVESLLILKKCARTFNFQSNEPLFKKNTLCIHRSLLRQCYCGASILIHVFVRGAYCILDGSVCSFSEWKCNWPFNTVFCSEKRGNKRMRSNILGNLSNSLYFFRVQSNFRVE